MRNYYIWKECSDTIEAAPFDIRRRPHISGSHTRHVWGVPATQLIREGSWSTIGDDLQAAILGFPIGSCKVYDVSGSDVSIMRGSLLLH